MQLVSVVAIFYFTRGGGTCDNLGGGGKIKWATWIVVKFLEFHVAMYA